jgi:hypothetical protein
VPAIVYDFKAIGGALRRQWLDDWWQPAKPEPEPKSAEPRPDQDEVWSRIVERLG